MHTYFIAAAIAMAAFVLRIAYLNRDEVRSKSRLPQQQNLTAEQSRRQQCKKALGVLADDYFEACDNLPLKTSANAAAVLQEACNCCLDAEWAIFRRAFDRADAQTRAGLAIMGNFKQLA